MAEIPLAELLGAMISGLVRGRAAADLEAVAIAERYRANPLMRHLAVPRFRIPEVTLSLPLVIAAASPPEQIQPAVDVHDPEDLAGLTIGVLKTLRPSPPASALKAVRREFVRRGVALPPSSVSGERIHLADLLGLAETMCRTAGRALAQCVAMEDGAEDPAAPAHWQNRLREMLPGQLIEKAAGFGELRVEATTSDVRENAGPGRTAILTVRLIEDGLEWVLDREEGTGDRQMLIPE